jgi:hypothetical protein
VPQDSACLECDVCGERLELARELWRMRAGRIGEPDDAVPRALRDFVRSHGEGTCTRPPRPVRLPAPGKTFRVVIASLESHGRR